MKQKTTLQETREVFAAIRASEKQGGGAVAPTTSFLAPEKPRPRDVTDSAAAVAGDMGRIVVRARSSW